MEIAKRIADITTALEGRKLVYFGTRGADAEPLVKIPAFTSIFSLIAPLQDKSVEEICLENMTGERVELDDYSIDFDDRPVVSEIRQKMLDMLKEPSVLLTYRPCEFLSSVLFPRFDRVKYLGLFHGHQRCFEHKAWVATQLAEAGVNIIPSLYYADEEKEIIREWADTEPVVLRANRSDGGIGVRYVEEAEKLDQQWPDHVDGFLSVSSFFADCISLNLNVCVFNGGTVSFHGPSVQLIGIPALTRRRFGYCGNDFGAAKMLSVDIWDKVEEIARVSAGWLFKQGYLGVFGIDALVCNEQVYLTEINPRFQGSSVLSARIDTHMQRSNIFIEHISAFLGMNAPKFSTPVRELVKSQAPMSHLVVHNVSSNPTTFKYKVENNNTESGVECTLLPRDEEGKRIKILPDGILFDLVFQQAVTSDGKALNNTAIKIFKKYSRQCAPVQMSLFPS